MIIGTVSKRVRDRRQRPPRSQRDDSDGAEWSRRWLATACFAVAALTLIVYLPVRRFDFVNWDDPSYLTGNPHVQQGLTWANVVWAITTAHTPYWHPMTWLSHMLDVTVFGMDPGAHHVTNLILHLANTLLVFYLLRRMTAAARPALFVAAVFGVHPLHVESVAWLAERKDVLSAFFLLLTIAAYLRYVQRPSPSQYGLVAAGYALALMSKPMVVTLPVVLLLLDFWPLHRLRRGSAGFLVVEKLPLFALAAATAVATVVVQQHVGAVAALSALPVRVRLANATVSGVAYIGKAIWPTHLAAFYPLRLHAAWLVAAAAALLASATWLAWRLRTSHPYVLTGWLWYLVTIAPVAGLIQAGQQGLADRFMYIPLIGLLIIAAWGISTVRLAAAPKWIAAIAVVLACAAAARVQVYAWANSTTLWEHAIAATPPNSIAYEKLGDAVRERGDVARAEKLYRTALGITAPTDVGDRAITLNSLGLVLFDQGKLEDASRSFSEAVRLNPGFAEAQNNCANALAGEGRYREAIEHYTAALRLDPLFTDAHVGLAAALISTGQPAAAVAHYRQALQAEPSLGEARSGLGAALTLLGQDSAAMTELTEALRLRPDLPSAHLNLAILLARQGRREEARQHLEAALAVNPDYEPARRALQQLKF
jgi:tetratricopeptide (TPR) repeat protein